MSINVDLGRVSIKTTIARDAKEVDECIQALMSNPKNYWRMIGLDMISSRNSSKVAAFSLLQLCDESQCLVFRFTPFCTIPSSLYNFLNLPAYTFVGFGIKDSLARLKLDYGFVCKNSLEAIQFKALRTLPPSSVLRNMYTPPTNRISDINDFNFNLPDDLIKLAVSNAYAAFRIGHEFFPINP